MPLTATPSYTAKRWQLDQHFRSLPDYRLTNDKRMAKEAARKFGIAVPREFTGSVVVKPNMGVNSRNVVVVRDGQVVLGHGTASLIEETVIDVDGSCPPRDFKCFCFDGRCVLIQVIRRLQKTFAYYTPDTWEQLHGIDSRPTAIHPRPECLAELVDAAERLSRLCLFPVRVDFYVSAAGPVFGEFCLSPGLMHWLLPAADVWLGELWQEHFRARGITDEFALKGPQL
jgi:hypothetical protein